MSDRLRKVRRVYDQDPNAYHRAMSSRFTAWMLGGRRRKVGETVRGRVLDVGFGTGLSVPVPDLDRTQHLLILGANPLVSNGSLMSAPNVRQRLKDIRARGGRVVADAHVAEVDGRWAVVE